MLQKFQIMVSLYSLNKTVNYNYCKYSKITLNYIFIKVNIRKINSVGTYKLICPFLFVLIVNKNYVKLEFKKNYNTYYTL